MKGPRICALRIQNGSNNILLDNTLEDEAETPVPIIYTRRTRLVDEELDDGREVALAYDHKSSKSGSESHHQLQQQLQQQRNSSLSLSPQGQSKDLLSSKNLSHQSDSYRSHGAGGIPTSTSCTAAKAHSRTPTSSISSELDLRRQQLSRVAEWVQNNSKITDLENNIFTSDNDGECMSLSDSQKYQLNAFSQSAHLICSRPTSGQQAQSMGGGSSSQHHHGQLVLQHQNNNHGGSMLLSKHHKDEPATTSSTTTNTAAVLKAQSQNSEFAQNNHKNSINLYKYFELYAAHQEDEEDEDDLLENENCNYDYCDDENDEYGEESSDKNMDDENQIDLAQMEYNVKQFLLKQSEWSIHNKISALGGSSAGTSDLTKTIPQRTETNL